MSVYPPLDIHRFLGLGRVTAAVPSPDGTWLAASVTRVEESGAKLSAELWRVSLTDPDARPVALTRGAFSDSHPQFRADGGLAFLSNRPLTDGPMTDRKQVWLLPTTGGEPHPVTDEPLGVHDFRFAKDGERLVVIADVLLGVPHEKQRETAADREKHGPSGRVFRDHPVRHWDAWLGGPAPHFIAYFQDGSGRNDLTPDADLTYRFSGFGFEWDLSSDGTRIAALAQRLGADRIPNVALHIINTVTGEIVALGDSEGVMIDSPVFSPDGERIACARHVREPGKMGRPELWLFENSRDPGRSIAPDWDVFPTPHVFSPDGKALLATCDLRGEHPIFRVSLAGGEPERLSATTAGGSHADIAVSFAPDGTAQVTGIRHRLIHPPEPFVMPLAAEAEPVLTGHLSGFGPEDGDASAAVEVMWATSEDGIPVHSFVVTPRSPAPGPRPTMLWIHGGPVAHHGDGWHWRWNPLIATAAGYTVVLPNPRGSTGFGQTFVEGVWNNRWGAESFHDVMAAADAACLRDDVDCDRMAAMGGSYGGYMANWIGGHTDRFRCIVTHASLYWMSAFYGSTDYPGWLRHEMGASPYDGVESFDRYSPHTAATCWKTPVLITHGERDYRVPITEALMLFEGVRARGIEAELLVFPDENHWILKPRNIRQFYEHVLDFVGRHMA